VRGGAAGGGRGLEQLTRISVCIADLRQGVFAKAIDIALAGFRKLDDRLRDHLVNAAIPDPKSCASDFEGDAHDARRLAVEPLTVQSVV
jgi:hypothetical protein